MINVNETVKNQQNIAFTKKVMPGIPACVVGCVTMIERLANT